MIVSTIALGAWMTDRAVSPWVGTLREMRRLEREGPDYYRADKRSSALYSRLEQAYFAIRRRDYDQALAHVAAGARDDPGNPLFDYMEACVHWEMNNQDRALAAVRSGNSKGLLRLYASLAVPPDRWQWPQFDIIRYTAKRIVADPGTDESTLAAVVVMGHKMAWCEPSDPVRLLQGIDVRQAAAERLEKVAERNGRLDIAELCRDIIDEGNALRRGVRRRIDRDSAFQDDTRAWIITWAVRRSDPRFRRIASLMRLEKQAEWAAQLRSRCLRPRNLEELEQ